MNIVQIATSVVSLLVPDLAKAGEGAAQKAGEFAWEKTKAIYQAIVSKFNEDEYAKQTLERLKEKPKTESRQRALVDVLAEKAEADSKFAQELNQLMKDTTQGQDISEFLVQVYGGEVGKIVSVVNAGDMNF
ncbi:MAG: hypothetical protein F6K18_13960 [Okeania sp. SIO2C2]|uniref:hypothetical protein n=1 Tax=Okeania sp. SIO2C2 TaxID=2607787 RepID=UPI0013BB8989|nr:hypothetical protein [Okeania sp. SIO2C2]NEP87833.1 hypothetical protein [Okeania sp. SIO2C2]